jgi:hypothetical protein
MDNYVLLYNFEDKGREAQFERKVKKEFWWHKVERNGSCKYFGFAGHEEPGVVDKIKAILDPLAGTNDYTALYFSQDSDPDKIKREMLLGPDYMVERDLEKVSPDAHLDSLTRLLNFDFIKAFPEPPEKK